MGKPVAGGFYEFHRATNPVLFINLYKFFSKSLFAQILNPMYWIQYNREMKIARIVIGESLLVAVRVVRIVVSCDNE